MVQILSPTGIEMPEGGELHSRAQYLRNLTRINQVASDLAAFQKGDKKMVFSNAGFAWSGNSASWDAGTLFYEPGTGQSSQQSGGLSFAAPGSLSGSIKFNEPGIYDAYWFAIPATEPGNSGYRIVSSPGGVNWTGLSGIPDSLLAQGIHMNGQSYFETPVLLIGLRVPVAGLEIRCVGAQTNSTTNKSLVSIIQRGKL